MANRRTQWIFVLASFVAVNGVLATVFLSQMNRPDTNERAVAVLGLSSSEPAEVATTSPPTDASLVEDEASASSSTTEPPIDRLVPDTVADSSDESDDDAESGPEDTTSVATRSDDVDPDAAELAPETDQGSEPANAGVEADQAVVDTNVVEAGAALSVESEADSPDETDPAADRQAEAKIQPVASAFASAESPEEGTPVAHAEVSLVTAREGPSSESSIIESFSNPTPRGGELVFQATGLTSTTGTIGVDHEEWIEVLLPVRPNGTRGWIKRSELRMTINPYRIDIDLSRHELVIYRYDEQRLATAISVGKGGTPTPVGGFFLTELLRPSDPAGAYGPYAYGLSGYSDELLSFNGGPGAIGIHGTNRPGLLGTDVSHGCIRVANPVITKMAEFLPLGTPVSIKS